jgi:hypothetical protein
MVIDIKRTVLRTQLRRFLTLIGVTVLTVAFILLSSLGNNFLGLNKYNWALLFGLIYFLSLIAESFMELNYIYFSDEDDWIILRYFSMSVFNRRKNSIEISKGSFGGYELHDSFLGIKKKIILKERIKDKKANYPPVSITGLNKKETNALLKTLDKYK